MGRWGRGTRLAVVPLLSMVAIAMSSQSVLANPIASPFLVLYILIPVNLPINGLLLMTMYALWVWFDGAPPPMGTGRFMELAIESVLVITLTGSIIDLFVFYGIGNWTFIAGGLAITAIVCILSRFVLGMSMEWSLLTGIAYFTVNILTWLLLDEIGILLFLATILILSLVVFIVLLNKMAFQFHSITQPVLWDESYIGGQGDAEPEMMVRGSHLNLLDRHRRQMRGLVLGLVVFCAVLAML